MIDPQMRGVIVQVRADGSKAISLISMIAVLGDLHQMAEEHGVTDFELALIATLKESFEFLPVDTLLNVIYKLPECATRSFLKSEIEKIRDDAPPMSMN